MTTSIHQRGLSQWALDHQLGICATILSIMHFFDWIIPMRLIVAPAYSIHITLAPESFHSCFVNLSYVTSLGTYATGPKDLYFIVYWIIMFWFLKAAAVGYIFIPLAKNLGIKKQRNVARFAEQSWAFVYYFTFTMIGFYLIFTTNVGFIRFLPYWKNYPVTTMTALKKWYSLVQLAFWLNAILTINFEEKRKDFLMLLSHHMITLALIGTLHTTHFHDTFLLALTITDTSDFLLPISKLFMYLEMGMAANISFIVFFVSWIVTRHGALLWLTMGSFSDTQIPFLWKPELGFCYVPTTLRILQVCSILLQLLITAWTVVIYGIVAKIFSEGTAKDSREVEPEEDIKDRDRENKKDEKICSDEKSAWTEEQKSIVEISPCF